MLWKCKQRRLQFPRNHRTQNNNARVMTVYSKIMLVLLTNHLTRIFKATIWVFKVFYNLYFKIFFKSAIFGATSNLIAWLCRTTLIFGTLKDGSL